MLTLLKPFGYLMREPEILDGIVRVEGITTATTPRELDEKIAQADILLGDIDMRLTGEIYDKAPRLVAVVCRSIGIDFVDVAAASERNILVLNSPDFCVKAVAEFTVGMMFMLARNFLSAASALGEDDWDRREHLRGIELEGRVLGLIGYGRIGREVARRAHGLGMRVVVFDPYVEAGTLKDTPATLCPLGEVLAQADVLSIHSPLTSTTFGLIGKEEIAGMKDGALLINASRGGIAEEEAVVEALKSGKLRGAALDAFTQEPPQPGHVLYKPELPNLITTPHTAWNTEEAGKKNTEMFVEQVRCIAKGALPPGVVNPAVSDAWLRRMGDVLHL